MSSSNPTISPATSSDEEEIRAERKALLVKTQKQLVDEMITAGQKVVPKPIPDDTSERERILLSQANLVMVTAASRPYMAKLVAWQKTLSGKDWEILLPPRPSNQVEGWDDFVDEILCYC
ncbi:hypothetical protein B0H16DRAFT_1724701 [Mycena metata]|uniref:Uncharacterized protein n=1 Tax=Mycena metata TaxID=1033252 RepID=A0AAD7IVS6_9AGAR|nr:hypothetical protein B0H16DRAFT_1724694 [Mycena metata]KAJ7750302.1 hypothetical protein B0H16DRAFT_1724701 [Mycena metata]